MKRKNKPKKVVSSRSGFEAKVMKDLDKRGVKYSYERIVFEYTKPARKAHYTPDLYFEKNNRFVEIKGRFTSKDRTKLLKVREENPGVDLRLLFQRDNKINTTSKVRYSDWAKKNNFIYHVGSTIPDEWL